MSKMFCRVCGREIKGVDWCNHVAMHKREYYAAKEQRGCQWGVNWEEVVVYFNPANAKKKYVSKEKREQKQLGDY